MSLIHRPTLHECTLMSAAGQAGILGGAGAVSASWYPTDLTGMPIFLLFDDAYVTEVSGAVSAVTNQGSGANFSQATVSARPLYTADAFGTGLNSAEGDGSADCLISDSTIDLSGTAAITIAAGYQVITGAGAESMVVDANGFSNPGWQLNGRSTGSGTKAFPGHQLAGGLNLRRTSTTIALDTSYVVLSTHETANAGASEIDTIEVNGASDLGTYSFTSDNSGNFGNVTVYTHSRGGSTFFGKLHLRWLIVLDHAADATERSQIATWGKAQVGL